MLKSCWCSTPGALLFDQERHRVHAEARHAELQPEAHDLLNLRAHVRIPGVQVGLVIVEPVEVVLAGLAIERPRCRLLPGKDDSLAMVLRPLVGPDVPVAEEGMLVRARGLEPRTIDRGVIDHQIDDDADAERLRMIHEVDEVARANRACRGRCSSQRRRSRCRDWARRRTAAARRRSRRARRDSRAGASTPRSRLRRRRLRPGISRRRGSR